MQDKNTPLHNAAYLGKNLITDILIKAGATLNAINKVSISIIEYVGIPIHDCILDLMLLQKVTTYKFLYVRIPLTL